MKKDLNCIECEMDNFIEHSEICNPFWDNHLFTAKDIARAKINWRDKLWLWIYPTKVQISEAGIFHFKVVNGAYYIMKITKF